MGQIPIPNPTPSPIEDTSIATCLGRTCMKWGSDGELTDQDFQVILQRLVLVDPQASTILEELVAQQPCPSSN